MDDTVWLHQLRNNTATVKPNREPRIRDINADVGGIAEPLLVDDDIAIRKQFRTLMLTPRGSEDHLPSYGSDISLLLYETISKMNASRIRFETIGVIGRWMSDRVQLILPQCSVEELEYDDGYLVTIAYVRSLDRGASAYQFDLLR